MTPEDVVAREAIRATLAAYHYAGDRGRIDDLVACFTEDGVLELSNGVHRGRDAIRTALSGVGGGTPPAFLHHHLTTTYTELTGPGTAKGSCYFLVMSPVGIDHSGRYADLYAEVDGQWLIGHRKAVVSWAAEDSVVGAKAG